LATQPGLRRGGGYWHAPILAEALSAAVERIAFIRRRSPTARSASIGAASDKRYSFYAKPGAIPLRRTCCSVLGFGHGYFAAHDRSLPWKWVFEGCDLYRDTGAALKNAGFSKVDLRPLILATMFVPIRHQITAVCVN